MDQATMNTVKQQLIDRRDELTRNVTQMADEIRSYGVEQGDEGGGVGNHNADDGSSVAESERLSTISADLREILAEIDGALERIAAGTFGTCLRCGKPIEAARLEAFPYVAYCITCQGIVEREMAMHAGQ